MGGLQKLGVLVIMVAGATTLLLPGRQTVPTINALTGFTRGTLATAMGTGKQI